MFFYFFFFIFFFFFLFFFFIFFFFFFFFLFFVFFFFFFFQAEDGIRDHCVTGVQTCALPISGPGDARGDPPEEGEVGRDRHPRPAAPHLHRRPRLDEHPRTRGRAHARRRVLVADG